MSTGAISFQYLAEIAIGESARVDLCRATSPPRVGQLLAVKRLHPHIADDPAFANQFMDEVWMTAALRHRNVVEVAGWGTDDEGMYLAVELVQGVSLARLMKTVFETGEIFTERMIVFIASELCRGLAAAHAIRSPDGELLQLVHRALSPGNVLVSFAGDVKIADFGLAKAKLRLTKTVTGVLKGQAQYMAPEQARARKEIDGRADLFALGAMLFELFAGRLPWVAPNEFQLVQVMMTQPPADLFQLRPKIDKELVAIVNSCLERDPAARFQSADEVLKRLDYWLEAHGYTEGNEETLARFVRRNAMKQMRWFERAVAGEPMDALPERPEIPMDSVVMSAPMLRKHVAAGSPSTQRSPDKIGGPPESETAPKPMAARRAPLPKGYAPKVPITMRDEATISESASVAAAASMEDDEESEELATVVQPARPAGLFPSPSALGITPRGAPTRPAGASGAPASAPIPASSYANTPGPKVPAARKSGAAAVRKPEGMGEVARRPAPPVMEEDDEDGASSEDMPTAPLRKEMLAVRMAQHGGAAGAPGSQGQGGSGGRAPPGQIVAPGGNVPPVPGMGAPPSAMAPPPLSAPVPPTPESETMPRPPAHSVDAARAAEARREPQAARGGEEARRDAPQAREQARPSPQANALLPPPPPDGGFTKEFVRAEADRIVFAAARLGDEARIAAEIASQLAALAKQADHAASIATDAMGLLGSAGLSEAARRLDEARAIDRSVQLDAASLPLTNAAPASVRSPSAQVMAAVATPSPGPQAYGPPPPGQQAPNPWSGGSGRHPPPGGPPGAPRAGMPSQDDLTRFRPTVLGMPQAVFAAAVVVGVVLLIVLLWVLFG